MSTAFSKAISEASSSEERRMLATLAERCLQAPYEFYAQEAAEDLAASAPGDPAAIALKHAPHGEAAGVLFARRMDDRWTIRALGVLPEWRRRGLGRQLLAAFLDRVECEGLPTGTPPVDSRNAAALRLLAGAGFVRSATETLRMRAQLQAADFPVDLPPGYSLRPYEPGDDAHWIRLFDLAFRDLSAKYRPWTPEQFHQEFLDDPYFQPERMLFLCSAGAPVGSATAWRDREEGRETGIVHWVMLDPAHRGRRLGELMMLACLNRLRADGWAEAYLTTKTEFAAAARLYWKLGFETVYRRAAHWKQPGR